MLKKHKHDSVSAHRLDPKTDLATQQHRLQHLSKVCKSSENTHHDSYSSAIALASSAAFAAALAAAAAILW